jgi:GT2 family glycosyltransferase
LTLNCLRHLAWYSGLPLEVIYIDNGSDLDVLPQLETEANALDLPLTIIRNARNLQFTRSVNQGLRLARGRHVLCINNDCFVAPECIERLYWHLTQSGERVAGVGPLTGDEGHQSLRHLQRREHANIPSETSIDFHDVLEWSRLLESSFRARSEEMLAFFCILIHRDAIERHGDLDESIHEFASGLGADDEWCYRVRRRRWSLKLALDAYAIHLGGSTFQRLQMDRHGMQRVALERLRRLVNE